MDRLLLSIAKAVTFWMTVTVMAPGMLSFVPVGPRGDGADEK